MNAPIFRTVTLQPTLSPWGELVRRLRDGHLNLGPSYQRGDVWGPERQRNLIRSIVMGLPTGALYFNQRDIMQPDAVIDGRQRLSAVAAFLTDEFDVPADWFPADLLNDAAGAQLRYSALDVRAQRYIANGSTITVYNAQFTGPDAEAREKELFLLVNFGGVAQGESDLA